MGGIVRLDSGIDPTEFPRFLFPSVYRTEIERSGERCETVKDPSQGRIRHKLTLFFCNLTKREKIISRNMVSYLLRFGQ